MEKEIQQEKKSYSKRKRDIARKKKIQKEKKRYSKRKRDIARKKRYNRVKEKNTASEKKKNVVSFYLHILFQTLNLIFVNDSGWKLLDFSTE